MKNDIDTYIAGAPGNVQKKLNAIRAVIKEAAPDATEKMSYGMLYYGYKGRLIYFAYFKDHISVFAMPPVPDNLKKKVAPYMTGKATIRFELDDTLPLALIRKLVVARKKLNDTKSK